MLYTKQIEQNEHYDIVVIGGGVAGFCAAVAAGRMGKRVALIEDMGALGRYGTFEKNADGKRGNRSRQRTFPPRRIRIKTK